MRRCSIPRLLDQRRQIPDSPRYGTAACRGQAPHGAPGAPPPPHLALAAARRRSAPGEDAAVAPGRRPSSSPRTRSRSPTSAIGAYAVAVNANDIVAMGGEPCISPRRSFLRPAPPRRTLERIFSDIADACARAGILWVGGHTEVTPVVTRTVVCGQAVGFLSGNLSDGRGEAG